jgi:hypothetical protein
MVSLVLGLAEGNHLIGPMSVDQQTETWIPSVRL